MLPIIFIVLNLLFTILIFYLLLAFLTGAPYVPSTRSTAEAMLKLAKISSDTTVYDLGSGDGKLLNLAMIYGAKKAIGYEINPFLVLASRFRFLLKPYRNKVQIYFKNFWHAKISDADVVFIYLLPWRMEKLKQKLLTEVKPGSLVVSNSFIFPNWKPYKSDPINHVYVFKIPVKVDKLEKLQK